MKAIKEAVQKLATMGSLPASLQSMLEAALREDAAHQAEPVTLPARKDEMTADWKADPGAQQWNACLDEIAKLGPLYTRPAKGEPVAWFMPELMDDKTIIGSKVKAGAFTFPLYTRADPAEVERLRDQLAAWQALAAERLEVATGLRAQLATETARADTAVGDSNEAERKLAEAHALIADVLIAFQLDVEGRGSCQNPGLDFIRPWSERVEALSARAEPIVTFTGDDMAEGNDRLGKDLGRIIEQQVMSGIERDERSAPVNPCMSASNFVEQYSKASGLSVREFYDEQVPMPDPTSPSGWAAVSNSPISIKAHVDTRLAEPSASFDRAARERKP